MQLVPAKERLLSPFQWKNILNYGFIISMIGALMRKRPSDGASIERVLTQGYTRSFKKLQVMPKIIMKE